MPQNSSTYIIGDVRDCLAAIPDGSIDLVMTSPPFLALRSYLPADHPDKHREIGSEPDPASSSTRSPAPAPPSWWRMS